eukprot:scaffold22737_cov120-Cylindrotheca_fusiformis.AAC.3
MVVKKHCHHPGNKKNKTQKREKKYWRMWGGWNEPVGGGCEVKICGFGKMGETPHMPGKNAAADFVDKILAADLERLSLKEREKVYEDVHGVSDAIQETPELIASCMEQMDHQIGLIQDKDAYEQAKLQSFDCVTNGKLRLAFLRSTSFNPESAALQLVQYFRKKLDIFGPEKLTRSSITLEDIGVAATRMSELGRLQILPNRDSNGRAVVVSRASFMDPALADCDDLSMVRWTAPQTVSGCDRCVTIKAFWYIMSALSEDEETQKKGFIFVWNRIGISGRHEYFRRALALGILEIFQVLPIRMACLHYCYNSSSPVLAVLASAAKSIIRVRVRTHRGSHTECLYELGSFGIPVQEFPFAEDGCIQLANQIQWLERRRKKETYLSKHPQIIGAVDLPSKHDVLLGRGKHRHPGNRLLHELVESYYDQYNHLPREGRSNLAHQLVAVVHGYSGRFLKFDNESGMWVEVSSVEAREKVTHRFRHSRALDMKGGFAHSTESIASWTNNGTDGGGKRSRKSCSGS